mmetsp:Transcript_130107/g.296676  ORF Transcript_130107/g.296676 Transcript_130107/m.296676 type:complete len:122 (-) Transcript_130107:66-431(-)
MVEQVLSEQGLDRPAAAQLDRCEWSYSSEAMLRRELTDLNLPPSRCSLRSLPTILHHLDETAAELVIRQRCHRGNKARDPDDGLICKVAHGILTLKRARARRVFAEHSEEMTSQRLSMAGV